MRTITEAEFEARKKRGRKPTYLAYRCYRCGRLLTSLEIEAKWAEAEKDLTKPAMGLCPCGSRHICPTNPKLWEELFLPRVWKLWYYEVFLPWLTSS